MAEMIAVVGSSGSGKSTSLRNLDPTQTFIINVAGKSLPFKGFRKNYIPLVQSEGKWIGNLYNTSNIDKIKQVLVLIAKTMPHIKQVILEDAQYLMAFEAMDRAEEKSYDKFTQIAQHFYSILKMGIDMRDDLKIAVLTHAENTGDVINPNWKIKTVGKMLDNMITIEGLFTYVFFTKVTEGEGDRMNYKFMTQTDGTTTSKTPMGCFDDIYIENDLQYVFNKIDEYNA